MKLVPSRVLLSTEDISSIVRDLLSRALRFPLRDLNEPVNLLSGEEMLTMSHTMICKTKTK